MGLLSEEDFDFIEIYFIYGNLFYNVSKLKKFIEYDEIVFLLDILGLMVMEKVICKD